MRVVVLTLFLAFVAGERLAPHFNARDTYVYKYETLLLSGLPEEGLAKAGLKLRSNVLISATAQNMYMLKLAEPELFEYSGIWPKGSFIKAAQLTSALRAQLTTPIKFEYNDGIVGKILVPEGIPKQTINIFKGILNVMNLNIKKTQNVYEMQEAGTQGVCKTLYALTEHEENSDMIHLTKTRDMSQCHESIYKSMGLAYTERWEKCEQFSKNLRGVTSYNYILKREQDSVLIMDVSVNELIQYSPFTEAKGAALTETKQSLSFLNIQQGQIPPSQGQYFPIESLKYEFSSEHLQAPLQLIKINNLQEQVKSTLNHLVTFNMEKVHEDAPLKFLELVQLLRVARYEDLQMIWQQQRGTTARQWILDAIPAIGNQNSLRFIKEKIQAEDITAAEAIQALMGSIQMVTANREAIKQVEELTVQEKIQWNPVLREIAYLGYGTMVYKYCAQNDAYPEDLIRPILDRLREAREPQDLILLLKVLGNAGHPASLKSITKALPIHGSSGASLPIQVHAEAIMALRNLARREPRMVQPLAVQLYKDTSLNPELRTLACIVLFETRPQLPLVLNIAASVKQEKNLQVASFTYSHMKSLTRSTAPIHASVASACNIAIKLLGPKLDRLSLRYSRAIHVDTYYNNFMLGAAASAFYINDAASILPRAVVAKTSAYFSGVAADVLEVGVRTEGLQEALMKNPELLENTDRLTKMKRAIKALSYLRSQANSRPLASIYFKLFGQEIAFANVDKYLIEEVFKFANGVNVQELGRALLSRSPYHLTKSLLATEVRHIMPTAAGFPLEFSVYTAAVATANIEVKATSNPQLPENFQLSHLLQTDLQLETKIQPSVALNSFVVMGVNTERLQATLVLRAKFNAVVPAHVKARLDFTEGNFKIEALPAPVPENIAEVQLESYAVSRNSEEPASERITPIIEAKALRNRETSSTAASESKSSEKLPNHYYPMKSSIKVTQSNKKYCKSVGAGLKACIKVNAERALLNKEKILNALVGRYFAALSVKQTEGDVQKLEMEVQFGPKAAEKLVKHINMDEEESAEAKPALMKLRKILLPSNRTSSSSQSSSSRSSSRSSSKSGSSSSRVNNSSGRSNSTSSSSSSSSRRSKSSSSSSSSSSRRSSSSSSSSSSSRRSSRSSSSSSSSSNASKMVKRLSKSKSSSASSVSSLFSGSSSSSRASARASRQQSARPKFQGNHQKRGRNSQASSSSSGGDSSFEAIRKQKKYLGSDRPPIFTILFRVIRADNRLQGYQIATYIDRPTTRVQIIAAALAPNDNWRFYVDSVALSQYSAPTRFNWGAYGRQYDLQVTAETGVVGSNPAARFMLSWKSLPSSVKRFVKMGTKLRNLKMLYHLMKVTDKSSTKKISLTVTATSDKTIDLMWKSKRLNEFYRLTLEMPFILPFYDSASYTSGLTDTFHHMLIKAGSAKCQVKGSTVTTFNNANITNKEPDSCSQILTYDCTHESKFMVSMKTNLDGRKVITIKVADIDVDLDQSQDNIVLKVNGDAIPLASLPYNSKNTLVKILQKGNGVSVSAFKYGLTEVYFAKDIIEIQVADYLRGSACGMCGKADGEVRQEFRSSNGRLSSNEISYAHSWTLPAESCRGNDECRLKHESVQLQRQVNLNGKDSQCFSVEPVLRCLPGCFPVMSTPVTVGFHCTSADSIMSTSMIYESNVDLREETEAHLACKCNAQCA